jgi:serine/threonine protein kinase
MAQSAHSIWSSGMRFSRYEILHRLARGGMADVWLARVIGIEGFRKAVVIKTMRPELTRSPSLVRMFVTEATIAARMSHPSVVHVFDFGLLDGCYFMAMEHVAGRSMRRLGRTLREWRRLLPRRLVLRLVADTARALAYAHAMTGPITRRSDQGDSDGDSEDSSARLGLVHNDVSPENIMVSLAGAAKLIDFGTASTREHAAEGPHARSVMGKLRYIGPERLRGHPADARTDVYALGIVLCEYLTGRHPFREVDLRRCLAQGKMPEPAPLAADLPRRLAAVVRKAMAPDPDKRYGRADDLADALVPFLDADLGPEPDRCADHQLREALRIEDRDDSPDDALDGGSVGSDRDGDGQNRWFLRVLTPLPPGFPGNDQLIDIDGPPSGAVPTKEPAQESAQEPAQESAQEPAQEPAQEGPEASAVDDQPTSLYATAPPSMPPPGERAVAHRDAIATENAPPGARGEAVASDPFAASVRRPAAAPGADGVAWFGGRADPERSSAAAASFERGLDLVGLGLLEEALVCWERAVSLTPERRWYRTNVERLRRRVAMAAVVGRKAQSVEGR